MPDDGVNDDAPALKAADMGVAMDLEGNDATCEASEIVLANDNFAIIVAAVKEGRVVWDNIQKVLIVNTPINNAQGLSALFGLLFGLKDTPISSIQVLYSNLICVITLGFVSAVESASFFLKSYNTEDELYKFCFKESGCSGPLYWGADEGVEPAHY